MRVVPRRSIGLFTEIYRPAVNGVVVSVEALAQGLRRRGSAVYCFAPSMPGDDEGSGPESVLRIPSLPLPARTPYRLTLPLVRRPEARAIIQKLTLIHVHSPFVTGWMGRRYARRFGVPLVYTYHTQLEAYAHYVPFEPNATRFAASQLTRTFANLTDAVIAPTAAMANRLRELGVTVRIEILPSGIDIAFFASGRRRTDLRARLGAAPADRLLLFVGRLAKEKNLELAIAAVAHANDFGLKLVVAGDGPKRAELEGLAARSGLARQVRFLGGVARPDLPDLYASADAFVMPSLTETQGLVLAEALAAGLAVVAADAPQNADVLGAAGRLVAPTPAAFAEALRDVASGVPTEVGAAARRAAARFSIDRQIDTTLALYDSLARPSGGT